MTAKTAFTADEWATLRNAPNLVAAAMMLAGNSGLFGSFKESFATAQSMFQGLSSPNELIKALSAREEISEAQTFVRSQVSFFRSRPSAGQIQRPGHGSHYRRPEYP